MMPIALSPAFYYCAGGYTLRWRSFHVNSFRLYICVYFVSIMDSLAVLISGRPALATTTRPYFTATTTLPFNAKMTIANLLIFGFATHKASLHDSSPLGVRWPGMVRFL
ncbi:hypothetical protein C8J57DRAFT_1319883 [Mycena rebaudengoi]|nr:hypothetical protein C8J57DRAFT_1319883 [Mycena rebaudengoi]